LVEIKKISSSNIKFSVIFSYQPLTAGRHQIFLAGDFNGFSHSLNKFEERNGTYYCSLELTRGKYSFKFIVDNNWITDIDAEEIIADGFGGHNSILYVGEQEEIDSLRLVKFSYTSKKNISNVYISGSFNNWSPDQDQLFKSGSKTFEITIPLNFGKYSYRFIADGKWEPDHNSNNFEKNSYNEENSIIFVDESFPKREENNNEILTYDLNKKDIYKYCNILDDNSIRFKVSAYKNNCKKITLLINSSNYIMELADSNHNFDYFQKDINWKGDDLEFCFLYENSLNKLYLGSSGFANSVDQIDLFKLRSKEFKPFQTPNWVKEGIIYQIFTDRFFNGDPAINQNFKEWYYKGLNSPPPEGKKLSSDQQYYNFEKNWYDHKALKQSPYHEEGIPDNFSFYGGDIAGIRKKLDYLIDLGITIIYLNPVFEARSNHKYDCTDYMKIDPHFGSNEEFRQLVSECHTAGIRIILDVAFNHTGDTFHPFTDSVEKGPESPYYHWFEWKKWPLPSKKENTIPAEHYSCWWGMGHMPDLDYDKSRFSPQENPIKNIEDADPNWDVVNYILDVTEFWLKDMDIDGFRLDVPNEVPFWFWELFRDKVKSIKADAYIVGEIWHNAAEWVGNTYFDAVMNYAYFKDPVILFFNLRKCSAIDFDKALKPGLMHYPVQATYVMMNLLDSHDTYRYLDIANGDLRKLKLAVMFQMTYIGTPHIWYGDEIGMMGAHDPDCRRPFNWKYTQDEEKSSLREFYRALIKIRKSNPVLIIGSFRTIIAEGMIYVYSRTSELDEIFVLLNNEDEERLVEIPTKIEITFKNLLTGKKYLTKDGKIRVKLKKYSGAIIKKDR